MKRTINVVKYAVAFIALGLFSPSVHVSMNLSDATYEVEYNILQQAEARRGGGGMRGGGMRAGGMRSGGFSRSRGGFSSSRMRAPSRSRYQGGNFHRSTRPAVSRPVSSRPVSSRPATRPAARPAKPVSGRPGKPGAGKPVKPIRPGNGNRPPNGGRPPHGKPPHHRPPHHGHPPHWHRPPHHYHGWGGYWPWFWGSAIVVGAIVSTIPDDGCRDLRIDGKLYKECEGVLFEPVYQGDDVGYKVVKIEK